MRRTLGFLHSQGWGRLLVVPALLLVPVGCGDDDSGQNGQPNGQNGENGQNGQNGQTPDPMVQISGAHSVVAGSTIALSAMTADGTDTGYTWASTDEAVATVDDSGMVTGVAPGEADITATGADTGATGEHVVVVIAPAMTGDAFVTVVGDFTILINETSQLTATTGNGDDASYTWTSSDESVAVVSDTGLVTGVGLGEAEITATGADTGASASIGLVVSLDIPIYNQWIASAHADRTSESFRHWDGDDPPEIPENCAKCHSTFGYLDFLGADGTAAGSVDMPAQLGSVVNCNACHNPAAAELDEVTFPSGVTITDAGAEARCMTCHQGRGSTDDVRADIAEAGVGEDEVSGDLSFSNIHYYAAGATLLAGQVRGAYQYENRVYDWRFRHVEEYDQCQECHDPHSLELELEACVDCHPGADTVEGVRDIRGLASLNQDYDGDGNTTEGIRAEIVGEDSLSSKLYTAIQAYATETAATSDICYSSGSYPYFFVDTNGSGGLCEAGEASFPNRYTTWTPRLLKAAYNYQVAQVDPGAYAHNAKYIIQALYDSIADLNDAIENDVDLSNAVRNDEGHFNGASEANRHWDEDAEVSARCSQCHAGKEGYEFYVEFGVPLGVPEQANGLECGLCHTDLTQDPPPVITVDSVTLPNGATFTDIMDGNNDGESSSNMCGVCHMGRNSGLAVDDAIGSAAETDILPGQSFVNPHYAPAYATRVGAEGILGYHYEGEMYAGYFSHGPAQECEGCHLPQNNNHSFDAQDSADACGGCHPGADTDVQVINGAFGGEREVDYDGDGTNENLVTELEGMADNVYARLQATASAGATTSDICYGNSYPYFFIDTDGSGGLCDDGEANFPNQYDTWTPQLLKGAYNWQVWHVDGGAWAHNFDYVGQLLYDSFVDLGGDPASMVRPVN